MKRKSGKKVKQVKKTTKRNTKIAKKSDIMFRPNEMVVECEYILYHAIPLYEGSINRSNKIQLHKFIEIINQIRTSMYYLAQGYGRYKGRKALELPIDEGCYNLYKGAMACQECLVKHCVRLEHILDDAEMSTIDNQAKVFFLSLRCTIRDWRKWFENIPEILVKEGTITCEGGVCKVRRVNEK